MHPTTFAVNIRSWCTGKVVYRHELKRKAAGDAIYMAKREGDYSKWKYIYLALHDYILSRETRNQGKAPMYMQQFEKEIQEVEKWGIDAAIEVGVRLVKLSMEHGGPNEKDLYNPALFPDHIYETMDIPPPTKQQPEETKKTVGEKDGKEISTGVHRDLNKIQPEDPGRGAQKGHDGSKTAIEEVAEMKTAVGAKKKGDQIELGQDMTQTKKPKTVTPDKVSDDSFDQRRGTNPGHRVCMRPVCVVGCTHVRC